MDDRGAPVAFFPILLDNSKYTEAFAPISIGISSWGSRDPREPDLRSQEIRQDHTLSSKIWMMPITPQDVRPKTSSFWETRKYATF